MPKVVVITARTIRRDLRQDPGPNRPSIRIPAREAMDQQARNRGPAGDASDNFDPLSAWAGRLFLTPRRNRTHGDSEMLAVGS